MRIGFASDIHQLVENRKLILAGVVVPFEKGEKAHSDGDVVYHALGESILGALALGDLGTYRRVIVVIILVIIEALIKIPIGIESVYGF